jgi:hypothetical protein
MTSFAIFVHIGLPKTGTSAIQRCLIENYEELIGLGYLYPIFPSDGIAKDDIVASGNGFGLYLNIIRCNDNKQLATVAIKSWFELRLRLARSLGCEKLIISSEFLSILSDDIVELLITSVRELCDDCRVLIFQRNPYEWLFSTWVQTIRRHGNGNWISTWIEKYPKCLVPLLLSGNLKKRGLQGELLLLDYDQSNGEILNIFLTAIDVPEARRSAINTNYHKINKSLSRSELIIYFTINKASGESIDFCNYIQKSFISDNSSASFYFYNPNTEFLIEKHIKEHGGDFLPTKRREPLIGSEADFFKIFSDIELSYIDALKLTINYHKKISVRQRELGVRVVSENMRSEFKNLVPVDFNAFAYILINADILYSEIDPYRHYVEFGMQEGRSYKIEQ